MFEVMVVSHGDFARALLESAQLIVGEQEGISWIGLQPGESIENFHQKVSRQIREKTDDGELLVLTDMQSGSPFNAVVLASSGYRFRHLTGINLPMVLEILLSRNFLTIGEACDQVLKAAPGTIKDVDVFMDSVCEEVME